MEHRAVGVADRQGDIVALCACGYWCYLNLDSQDYMESHIREENK
jgi:hypothetical protein